MLRLALLIALLASVALSGVANFCVQEPFRQMQDFREFEPAMSRCAAHYPAQTILKTLPNTCLTTTKTVILGTSTVHATNHLPCPTIHLEVRGKPNKHHLKEKERILHEKERIQREKERILHQKEREREHRSKYRSKHHHTLPHSMEPRDFHNEGRNAGPTAAAVLKRDAMATKTAEWSSYYTSLVECGYDCIQTACSCVASPRVELQTPKPTCTSTETKQTVVHETKTIDIEPEQC